MLTSVGSGCSRWRDLGVTRSREDSTRDDSGSYFFLRDIESGALWSAGYQPSGVEPDSYEVNFTEDRAEFIRSDGAISTILEVLVSPEDDAEIRRMSIVNASNRVRDLEITSYCELVLAPPAADTAHPAFSKLFVQTEYVAKVGALLATRRRRSPAEPEIWVAHPAVIEGDVLYADASVRPSSDRIRRGAGGPAALWTHSISGDLPIVLLRIADVEDIAIARQLLRAHEYWRIKRLSVDLVILNERTSYLQDLQMALETQLRMSQSQPQIGADNPRGSVFLLRADLLSEQTSARLSSVARVVLVAQRGNLADQLDRLRAPAISATRRPRSSSHLEAVATAPVTQDLEFFNGLGGFSADGREYVTLLGPGQATPAPWINVIANPGFGFQVAADGGGFTWALNSRENQLTPWSNDPVTDRPGEVLYVRDQESGELWGPTAAPLRDQRAHYSARHGQGYSRFEHASHGIDLDLIVHVPMGDPIKISRLKIHNSSQRSRRLSVTAYAEWVLGPSRAASAPFIVTAIDTATGAMFAHNPWNTPLGSYVAFADLAGRQTQWTADRREFLGRHGTLDSPAALTRQTPLSKRVGAGLDPCCALQTDVELG